jgi:tetratricopeptide (TPR) repeat protein
MRLPLLVRMVAFCIAAVIGVSAAEQGTIFGTVQSTDGKPFAGVIVRLSSHQAPAFIVQTTSGAAGEYRIEGLPPGEYSLSADSNGMTAIASAVIPTPATPIKVNLTMARQNSGDASGTTHSGSPLQFQAAGIRGLIDPGGYSASANAAAATVVVKGIADIRRTNPGRDGSAAKAWPCDLEPELQRMEAANPDSVGAARRLGEFYVAHDQPSMAIPLLQKTLRIDPDDFRASQDLAVAWLETKRFDEARTILMALAQHKDEAAVHQLLARADEGSGMFAQASQEYDVANREEPSEESLFGVGYERILSGSTAEAAKTFEAGERQYSHSVTMQIGEGAAQFLMGHSAEAVHSFLEATDLNPSDPRPYPFLASASGMTDAERTKVRESFKRFLGRVPNSATANYYYAVILSREQNAGTEVQETQIETLLKRAIQLDPDLAKAHLQLAGIYAQRNDDNDAVRECEIAVRLSPELSEVHYRLAIAYRRTGHTDQSAREMQIFQELKAQQKAATGEAAVDIAQFVSVMDAPGGSARQEAQCPASPR